MTVTVDIDLSTAKRVEKERSVSYEWFVGKAADGRKDLLAVLTIRHNKAGANYFTGEIRSEDSFSVALNNETEEVGKNFTSRGFTLFSGVGLARLPAGKRFSRKRLHEAAGEGLALLVKLVEDGDERVTRYFDGRGEH